MTSAGGVGIKRVVVPDQRNGAGTESAAHAGGVGYGRVVVAECRCHQDFIGAHAAGVGHHIAVARAGSGGNYGVVFHTERIGRNSGIVAAEHGRHHTGVFHTIDDRRDVGVVVAERGRNGGVVLHPVGDRGHRVVVAERRGHRADIGDADGAGVDRVAVAERERTGADVDSAGRAGRPIGAADPGNVEHATGGGGAATASEGEGDIGHAGIGRAVRTRGDRQPAKRRGRIRGTGLHQLQTKDRKAEVGIRGGQGQRLLPRSQLLRYRRDSCVIARHHGHILGPQLFVDGLGRRDRWCVLSEEVGDHQRHQLVAVGCHHCWMHDRGLCGLEHRRRRRRPPRRARGLGRRRAQPARVRCGYG